MENATRRLTYVQIITAAAILCALAIGWRMWLADPIFGSLPVFDWIPSISTPWDFVSLAAIIALTFLALFPQLDRRWLFAWIVVVLLRCLWDRLTWQPYYFQYFVTLAMVFWARSPEAHSVPKRKRKQNRKDATETPSRERQAWLVIALMLGLIYFWSGVAKLNHRFLYDGTVAIAEGISKAHAQRLSILLRVIPFAEASLLFGLLSRRTRKAFVIAAVSMHLFLLLLLGPLGINTNPIVWPWNAAMICLVIVVFWNADFGWREIARLFKLRSAPAIAAALLFVVAPILARFGLWDPALSYRLYAGDHAMARIYMTEKVATALPEATSACITRSDTLGGYVGYLRLPSWPEEQTSVYLPSNPAIYRRIIGRVFSYSKDQNSAQALFVNQPDPWTGKSVTEVIRPD